ncbi:MAG: PorV/PorQ family protein [bacterium]|nr:PorV/PorQ family protein [bacterium]
MKRILTIILTLSLIALSVPAFAVTTGGTSAQFLKIPIGPRAEAMGGAFTGLADDGSALFWNPAGTAQVNKAQMVGGYVGYVAKIKYEYFAASFPIGEYDYFGIGLGALNTPPMLVTSIETVDINGEIINNLYGATQDEFNASDNFFIFNYSRRFVYNQRDLFYLGVNLKYIRESLEEYKDFTVCGDLGLIFKLNENFRLGLAVQNMGGSLKFIEEEEQIPQSMRFGVSYYFMNNELNRLVVASDIIKFNDEDINVGLGGEYVFRDLFSLRLGYKNTDLGSLTAGCGVIVKFTKTRKIKGTVERIEMARIGINYSFVDFGDLGQTHRYSMSFTF